jgi:malate dehydrogenase (oxaloacetate-decarboxylating)
VVATGRSDYPNQINNVLAFPGVFRGLLDAHAHKITDDMMLAAANAIAELARDGELVPNALDQRVHDAVAEAVKSAASTSGIARPDHATTEL